MCLSKAVRFDKRQAAPGEGGALFLDVVGSIPLCGVVLRVAGCHKANDPDAAECPWKGRKHLAGHEWAAAHRKAGVDEAQGWLQGRFGSVNIDEALGCVRAA